MPVAERNIYNASTNTRCFVEFFTDERNGFSTDQPIQAHPELGRIVGVSTTKQLGSASGSFSITVKKDQQFRGPSSLTRLWVDPESVWVRITFSVDGQRMETMLGIVDAINEKTRRSGLGQREETYVISGRDFGKVFENTELFVNFHQIDAANKLTRSVGNLQTVFLDALQDATPDKVIRILLQFWLGNNGLAEAPWRLPRGLGNDFIYNLLKPNLQIQRMNKFVSGTILEPRLFQVDQDGGKLWDVMQEYCNGLLNELWVDLGPDTRFGNTGNFFETLVPTVYLRERPFPTFDLRSNVTTRRKWNQLRTRVLELRDVQSRSVSKGGASQRFNYWQLQINGLTSEAFNIDELLQRGVTEGIEQGFPGSLPIINAESIQRNGLRRYVAQTKYLPTGPGSLESNNPELQNYFRLAASFLKKAHDWYGTAPFELSGRIVTTRVMPEIRVGERVQEKRSEGTITYYCEGVDHSWVYPGAGTTTLTLTRGEYDEDDLLAYLYEQYQNPNVLNAQEACTIPSDVNDEESETEFNELIQGLNRGCGFAITNEQIFTTDTEPLPPLEVETSEVVEEANEVETQDPGMLPVLDDTLPQDVGTPEAIPAPDSPRVPRNAPALDQGSLERGEPINVENEITVDLNDPIAGADFSEL